MVLLLVLDFRREKEASDSLSRCTDCSMPCAMDFALWDFPFSTLPFPSEVLCLPHLHMGN